MNWLNKLKTIQTALPEVNQTLPIIPEYDLSKLSKVSALNKADSYPYTKNPDLVSAYCAKYAGHCSVKIGGKYPAECSAMCCEYHGLPDVLTKRGVYKLADYCPEPTDQTTKHTICPNCKGDDFWQSAVQENHTICRRCHPPAPGAEKVSA